MKVAILDGYVDEPSCLGVPPYVAPYPRYIYGMLKSLKISAKYVTIDSYRQDPTKLENFDLVIVIAGIAVPGKYLGGKPLSLKELYELKFKKSFLVGPITLELTKKYVQNLEYLNYEVINFPFEEELFKRLSNFLRLKNAKFNLDKFSVLGSDVVKQHPDYPHLICEIETYRGCYWRKCSFCIERIHGKPRMRNPKAVLDEIESLYNAGVRHFRLGRQTDFLTYMANFDYEIPKPNPEFMKNFHREIWRRCPKIRVLHLDNINPKTIAEHPDECRRIIKTIILHQTPGNVAAMGLESADEKVIKQNNLAADVEDVKFAIELVNRYGRFVGYNGLPYFLPGINFVIGLKGETKETFEKNFEFLKNLLDSGMLLRRINIRQVKIFENTPMRNFGYKNVLRHKKYFKIFKKKVREEIDNAMLKKILPVGRKITDLRCEINRGKITYARQLATYPLLVGVVGKYEKNTYIDAKVVGYGMRSITAIEPLNINKANFWQLEYLPISKKTVAKIILKRPFENIDEIKKVLGKEYDRIKDFIYV
ncbi:MAG: radical SAM protein [Archaeoglobaceae archaeon]|nr:radical SAM protein [Archaeoglobaceae archaeon]